MKEIKRDDLLVERNEKRGYADIVFLYENDEQKNERIKYNIVLNLWANKFALLFNREPPDYGECVQFKDLKVVTNG